MIPGLSNSTFPPSESLTTAFRSAFEQLSQIEPSYWKKADMMWYFSRLVRMLSLQDYTLFRVLYETAHRVEEVDIPHLFHQRAALEDNKQLLAALRENDLSEEDLKKAEGYTFGRGKHAEICRSVARKLTVMSEINRGFVADKKLWRWIEDVAPGADTR